MSKLSGLIFLTYDEVLVANDVTDECPGLRGRAGVYTLLCKAVGNGVGGACLESSSSESPPCEVTELASLADMLLSLRLVEDEASGGSDVRGFHWERLPSLGRGGGAAGGDEEGFCSKAAIRSRREPGLGLTGVARPLCRLVSSGSSELSVEMV
jgi:hypothetical protein